MSSSSVVQPQTLYKNGVLTSSSSISPSSPSSSSSGKISPAILFIIIIIAVIFFVSGVLHLLVRLLTKHHRRSSESTPESATESSATAFQRQLQQLFHLHDSGLDQSFIDALPVFLYAEVAAAAATGPAESFDCAVCLCEFSGRDSLRLLPLCSHAFHVDCIDTWLLSNSTCPLCRQSLYSPGGGLPVENPLFCFDEDDDDHPVRDPDCRGSPGDPGRNSPEVGSGRGIGKRVFSVRLGKFRSVMNNSVGVSKEEEERGERERVGEKRRERETSTSTSSSLDSRRCYSMGSYQYVVADSDLQVVASRPPTKSQLQVNTNDNNNNNNHHHHHGKKIMNVIGTKGDSFSVSKIWQWPRKPTTSLNFHE